MFRRNKHTRNSLIIQDHVIRYVRAKRPELNAIIDFQERYLPVGVIENGKIVEHETLRTIIEECMSTWKIKGEEVFFTIPDSVVVLRHHQIPESIKEEEIIGHLFFELGEKLHLPFENPLMDIHDLGLVGKMREVLVFAAPEDTVSYFANLLEECKAKPVVADLSPLSYFRLYFETDLSERYEHMMLVQCYRSQVNVTIFHDQVPLMMRSLKWELSTERWTITEEASVSIYKWNGDENDVYGAWEEILKDIEKLINFYRFTYQKGEAGVNNIIFTGDHPFLRTFEGSCEKRFDIPVKSVEILECMTIDQEQIPTRFYEGVGLVLKKEV